MSTDQVSTRVNSAKLPNFRGQTVRLACKPLNVSREKILTRQLLTGVLQKAGDILIVEASDGGQVNVVLVGVRIAFSGVYTQLIPYSGL